MRQPHELITPEMAMYSPDGKACDRYTMERMEALFGGGVSPEYIATAPLDGNVSAQDRLWRLLQRDMFTENEMRLLALRFVEASLPNSAGRRGVIGALRRWTVGRMKDGDVNRLIPLFKPASWSPALPDNEAIAWVKQNETDTHAGRGVLLAFRSTDPYILVQMAARVLGAKKGFDTVLGIVADVFGGRIDLATDGEL
jgi:hypothetical protein